MNHGIFSFADNCKEAYDLMIKYVSQAERNINKLKQYKLTNYNINKMYENQHNEIIYNKVNNICSYADGKKINYIIDKIKKY